MAFLFKIENVFAGEDLLHLSGRLREGSIRRGQRIRLPTTLGHDFSLVAEVWSLTHKRTGFTWWNRRDVDLNVNLLWFWCRPEIIRRGYAESTQFCMHSSAELWLQNYAKEHGRESVYPT